MPWNCLCSSEKQKHKLEISAPILNRDEKRNAKIIQNPTKDGNQKALNLRFQRNANQAEIASNNNYPDDSKLRNKSSSKQKHLAKKNAKNAKDSHTQFLQSGEEQNPKPTTSTVKFSADAIDLNSNSSPPRRAEPEEEDTTYSQLIFDRKINKPNEPSSANGVNASTSKSTTVSHLAHRENPNTGHYDRLPFDKSSEQSMQHSSANQESVYGDYQTRPATQNHGQPYYQGKQSRPSSATGAGMPNGDSIPFIDEEDIVGIVEKHGTHLRINESNDNDHYATSTRIITLHPKNIGSSQTIQRGSTLKRTPQLSNKSDASPREPRTGEIVVIDSNENVEVVSRSTTASPSPANQIGRVVGVHEFFAWNPAKGKLCQFCHESALNTVVKCRSCDMVCHLWCVPWIVVSGSSIHFI